MMKNLLMITLLLVGTQAFATDLTIPHSFSANTPALADEVNTNFNAIEIAVNSKQDQLSGTNCATGEVLESITANGTGACVELSPQRTGYLSLPGEAFVSASGGPVSTSSDDGGAWTTGTNNQDILVAPVHLPQGARITELRCWMRSASPSRLQTSLNRRSLSDPGISPIITLMTPGYNTSIVEFTSGPLNEIVDNSIYSYMIRIRATDSSGTDSYWPGNNALQISAVRITYTY